MKVICSKRRGSPVRLRTGSLRRLTERAAELANTGLRPEETLCVHFVGSAEIERVNKEFVGHEGMTDVICFDYRGGESPLDEDDVAAEILICPEAARRQNETRGRQFHRELALYLIHGLLHLAGEDDLDPASRRRMRRKERAALEHLEKEFDFEEIFRSADCTEAYYSLQ